MIFYPGKKYGYDGPIPCIRLKAMRRGLQDLEYALLLEQKSLMSRSELLQLADELLLSETPDYAQLRRLIFDRLAGG